MKMQGMVGGGSKERISLNSTRSSGKSLWILSFLEKEEGLGAGHGVLRPGKSDTATLETVQKELRRSRGECWM